MTPPPGSRPASLSTLFLVSVLALLLEVMLIRWLGTEITIYSYLQNCVLVVCLLGMGMGCWTSRIPVRMSEILAPLFVLLVILVPVSRLSLGRPISLMLNPFGDLLIYDALKLDRLLTAAVLAVLAFAFTGAILFLLWQIFVPIGRLVGRELDAHPRPILAYTANIAGSLVGVWLFVGLSALAQPPWIWVGVCVALLWALRRAAGGIGAAEAALLAGIVLVGLAACGESGALETIWSPYQKLALHRSTGEMGQYYIAANSNGYFQVMIDLSDKAVAADPVRYPPELAGLSQYDLPLLLRPGAKTMLIVGAGSGNGSAAALRHGIERVDAVDIDPVVIDYGRRYHPEKPYDSPRVRVVNDDARAFFTTATDRYDVISFEFLDSHAVGSMTNTRLDHYVYTRESFQQAKALLAPGGIAVLIYGYERPFLADRMVRAFREVFGQEPEFFTTPLTNYGPSASILVGGDLAGVRAAIEKNARLAAAIARWRRDHPITLPGSTIVATDDWPYVYLEEPRLPRLYWAMGLMLVVLVAVSARRTGLGFSREAITRPHAHFFLLGAAFMLLEVQNVSKAAAVLGSTWQVNAVIISGVLVLILASNLIAARWPGLPPGPFYALLVASCLALYAFDLSRLTVLPYATRAVATGLLTSLPMLFSGVIFIRSFAQAESRDMALGANLLGSLVGAMLQSITFLTGIRALLLVVAALYIVAYLTSFRDVQPHA